jgi:DNA invertase Pin-like site-specific DNA recombinase
MKAALYARVSTIDKDQNPEVQLSALREYCRDMGWEIYKEYIDQASAVDLGARSAWRALVDDAARHRFDVLLVWKLDRAFRSVVHAANTLEQLRNYKVQFKSYTEAFMDTTTPIGEYVYYIMAAAAGLERQMVGQRVKAGMSYAQAHGTKSGQAIGRPRKKISDAKVLEVFVQTGMNYYQTGKLLGVNPGFVFNRVQGIQKAYPTLLLIKEKVN